MALRTQISKATFQPPEIVDLGVFDNSGKYWDRRRLDSYNRMVEFAIGPRDPGKTTRMLHDSWKVGARRGQTLIYFVRYANIITPSFVQNEFYAKLMKFFDLPAFEFSTREAGAGLATIYAGGFPYVTIVALNCNSDKLKKALPQNPWASWFDEAILDLKKGDRYLPNEARKLMDLHTTILKAKPRCRLYITGNIYSLYNPYFLEWKVDTTKLRKGEVYTNDLCAVEMVDITPKLREELIARNDFYRYEEEYRRFALNGEALNDIGVRIVRSLPRDYSLRFILFLEGRRVGIYGDGNGHFWAGWFKGKSPRTALSFDIKQLINGTRVFTREDKLATSYFKGKMGEREVSFQNLECYYLLEDIYPLL